jgi:hypothetical protein
MFVSKHSYCSEDIPFSLRPLDPFQARDHTMGFSVVGEENVWENESRDGSTGGFAEYRLAAL